MTSNHWPLARSVGFAALLVLGLGASQSFAANWVEIGKTRADQGPRTDYYDAESVRVDGNLRYVWTKMAYARPTYERFANGYVSSGLGYWVVDCLSRTSALSQSIYRDVNENNVFSNSDPNLTFEAQPPGSVGESLIQTVCNLGAGKDDAPRAEGARGGTGKTSIVGSGFVVSSAGFILTNAHVVSGCEAIRVTTAGGERRTASLAAADPPSDLALLRISGGVSSVASFRVRRPVQLGEEIVALGYPLHGLLASGVNVSSGTVSALAGLADDSTKLQISAPVQPGNSGGPVLDLSGGVVGIVVAKLDAIKMAQAIGDIPQNVNFAIKADVARLFLEAHVFSLQSAQAGPPRKKEDVAAMGREFTVLVECLKGQDAK